MRKSLVKQDENKGQSWYNRWVIRPGQGGTRMDKLEGIIKSTIFRNEENGYTVLVLKAGKRLHTV